MNERERKVVEKEEQKQLEGPISRLLSRLKDVIFIFLYTALILFSFPFPFFLTQKKKKKNPL